MASNEKIQPYAGCVNPDDFPEERLLRERLVLLKCVKKDIHSVLSGDGESIEVGEYYIGIAYYDRMMPPEYTDIRRHIILADSDGSLGTPFQECCFRVISDPCEIMTTITTTGNMIYHWRKAQEQLVDKPDNTIHFIVHHEKTWLQS